MTTLSPPASLRVVDAADGLTLWLAIPHALRSLSFLLETPGTLWCAMALHHAGGLGEQCWLSRLDCATGELSFERLDPSYAQPLLRRHPSGAPFVLGRELPTLRSVVIQPIADAGAGARRRAALPKGASVLRALGAAGLLGWQVSTKTFRATHLCVGQTDDATLATFPLPRGFELIDALPTPSGYALFGAQGAAFRCLWLDPSLTVVADARIPADGVVPKAMVRGDADGTVVAVGQRGAELGRLTLTRGGSADFVSLVTLPFGDLDSVNVQTMDDRDAEVAATFTFRYAGQMKQGSGALRLERDGAASSVFTSMEDQPGTLRRGPTTETLADGPVRLDFHGRVGSLEVACFDRSWLPDRGYTTENRQLIRVWRHGS